MRKRIDWMFENSGFLVIGSLLALGWANLAHHSYSEVVHRWHFWVNDVAMALFFAMAGKEIFESFLPGGALSSLKKSATPLFATIGGMVAPAGLFTAACYFTDRTDLYNGWAIPCATDIAFSYLAARVIFGKGKHPAISFLLLLAIADDALGLIILAVFYPTGALHLPLFLGGVLAAVLFSYVVLNRVLQLTSFWWYAIPGTASWLAFYWGGIHPALSLVPIVFTMPHAKDDRGLFAAEEGGRHDTLNVFEHWFKRPVELILGMFGLVNAGVVFGSIGAPTFFVCTGLLIGKPLGIFVFTLLALRCGFTLATGLGWRDILVVGCTAAIGFTVALFVSTVAFSAAGVLDAAKMGALLSFLALPLSVLAARLLQVGVYSTSPVVAAAPDEQLASAEA